MSSSRLLFAGVSTMRDHAGQHKLYFIADALGRAGIPVSLLVPDRPENHAFTADKPHLDAHFYPSGTALGDVLRRSRVVRHGRWSAIWIVGVGLRSWILRTHGASAPPLIKDFDEFPSMIGSFGPLRRSYLRWIERRMIAQADAFTCASALLEGTVRRQRPDLGRKLLRLRVAISEHEHRVDPALAARLRAADGERPTLLYLGSLNRFYADQLEEIFQLAAEFRRRGVSVGLRILGGGPDAEYFKARARTVGVASLVHFQGHVEREDLASHMDAARVLLFPFPASPFNLSRCPTKAFHYAAANRPVVTNRTGEVAALLGEAAWYYPEGDLHAFADACARALQAPPDWRHGIPFAALTWDGRAREFATWLDAHGWLPRSAPGRRTPTPAAAGAT